MNTENMQLVQGDVDTFAILRSIEGEVRAIHLYNEYGPGILVGDTSTGDYSDVVLPRGTYRWVETLPLVENFVHVYLDNLRPQIHLSLVSLDEDGDQREEETLFAVVNDAYIVREKIRDYFNFTPDAFPLLNQWNDFGAPFVDTFEEGNMSYFSENLVNPSLLIPVVSRNPKNTKEYRVRVSFVLVDLEP